MEDIKVIHFDPTGAVRLGCDIQKRSQSKRKPTYSTKTGRLRVNPMTCAKARVHGSPRRNKKTGDLLEAYQSPLPWSSGFDPYLSRDDRRDLIDEAAAKWYSELANTNALLPLMFKERQKTVDLVAKKVLYFARIRKNFVKGMLKHLKGDSKARHEIMESKWLEYRYGWLPTLADINKLVNQPLGLPSTRVYARRFKQVSYDDGKKSKTTPGVIATGNFYESYGAYVYPKDINMQVATQYGIANPALVLWEMVPFSFAVDWFLDVGGYLESLGALNGLEIDDYWRTYGGSIHVVKSYQESDSYSSGYSSLYQTNSTRIREKPVYPNPLIPSNGLNLTRLFDAIALCDTIFGKSKRT